MSDAIEIRAYRPGDEHGLVACFNQVFAGPGGAAKPRTLAHWRWKFLDNPANTVRIAVGEHPTDGIVGCYGTIPARIRIEGKDALAGQAVDVFVLPQHRRAPRPGLFVHLTNAHYELYGCPGDGRDVFHYGWPGPNWRLGQRYLRYENIRDWDFLFRELGGAAPRAEPSGVEVRRVARFSADADALWRTQQDATQLALVRDAAYLNWRYADAHDRTYVLFECRDRSSGVLRALSVATVCDFLFPHTAFLVDWVCPLADDDATVAMVAAAERFAREQRAAILATQFFQQDPRFLRFQRLGFLVYGTAYFLVVVPFDTRGSIFYREQWYHTCGDSDLV